MFLDKDAFSLLKVKREQHIQQFQKESRNKIFEEKRMAIFQEQRKRQDLQIININEVLQLLKGNIEEIEHGLQYLANTLENNNDLQNEIIELYHLYGVIDYLVDLLDCKQKLNTNILISVTFILSFIMILDVSGQYFINLGGIDHLENLLLTENNIVALEYCFLCLGNIEQYKISKSLDQQILPRLFNYLSTYRPLPEQCLITFSWMLNRIQYPNQHQYQLKLIELENSNIMFEAIQHCQDNFNLNEQLLKYLAEKLDPQDYLASSQLVKLIINNLTPQIASSDIIPALINKCLYSGKVMLLNQAYALAKHYMILTNKIYYSDFVIQRTISLLQQSSLLQQIMSYLETLLLQTQIPFPDEFFKQFLNTMSRYHLRVLPILLIYYEQKLKSFVKLSHKALFYRIGNDESQEMIQKLF